MDRPWRDWSRPAGGPRFLGVTRLRRVLVGLASVVVLLVVTSGVASAHAQLESTSPSVGSVLLTSPSEVVLHFGEPVEIDFGSLRVIGPRGNRVDDGGTHHPVGDTHSVAVSVEGNLLDGTYVVAWRVISAASHPEHGAFVFSVGTAAGAKRADALATSIANQSGSSVVGVVYWVVRTAAFVGLLFLVGPAVLLAVIWREGAHSRRVGKLLWWMWGTLVVATVAGILVQGIYASALPLTDIVRPSLISDVLHTRFGEVELLRLLLLAAMVPVLLGLRGRLGAPDRRWVWVTPTVCLLSVGLLLTPGLAGHASTGSSPLLGTLLDVGHLAAAAAWLGGLALLATFLVTRDPGDALPDDPSTVTRRVSAVAYAAVAVVVATGVVQSIRQVGSFYALFHTSYGVTLLVKIGLVVVLVALGAASRHIVHGGGGALRWVLPDRWSRRPDDAGDVSRSRLRRSVLAELGVALAVLGVTAALVNAVPADQAVAQPFTYSVTTLGVQVNAIVSPAVAGPTNQIHVYVLSSAGTPRAVPELDLSLSLPSESIGPLTIPLTLEGPGHYYADNVDIPVAGSWVMKLTVRTDAIDEQEVTTTVPVR